MAGTAHITHGLTRWPGKPTSGRFVYRSRVRGGWYWQCDLHDDDPSLLSQYGGLVSSMQEALAGALAHAAVCVPSSVD
jgi:hypothetical protein